MKTLICFFALMVALNTQAITLNGPLKLEDYKTPDFELIYPMVPRKDDLLKDLPEWQSNPLKSLCTGYSIWEGSLNGGYTTLYFNFTQKVYDGSCMHILTVASSSGCLIYSTEYKTSHAVNSPTPYAILQELIAPHFTIYCQNTYEMSWFINQKLIAPEGVSGTYILDSSTGILTISNSIEYLKLSLVAGSQKIWFS